jgi:hypothetical protein
LGGIYANAAEAAMHEAALDALSAELHRPVAEIRPHYEREVKQLQEGARVRDFVSVRAARHTRDTLRSSSH